MEEVVLIINMILALAIIGLVLLQRSEGGGLGIGGSGGLGGLATPQGAANLLTRMTSICAGLFFLTSLALGVMAGQDSKSRISLVEELNKSPVSQEAPVDKSISVPSSTKDAPKETPSVPIAK